MHQVQVVGFNNIFVIQQLQLGNDLHLSPSERWWAPDAELGAEPALSTTAMRLEMKPHGSGICCTDSVGFGLGFFWYELEKHSKFLLGEANFLTREGTNNCTEGFLRSSVWQFQCRIWGQWLQAWKMHVRSGACEPNAQRNSKKNIGVGASK